ncbi:uncharacterized protein CBL_12489 [Carabus blaptoides fortunei]
MPLNLAATVKNADKHEYDVTSLIYKNGKIYSAADDGKIKMWSTELELEKEIQAHPCSVYSLTADNSDLIYSCSSDGSIRAWKTTTLEDAGVVQAPGDQEMWKIYWADDTLCSVDDQGIINVSKNGKIGTTVIMMEQIKDIAFKDDLIYSVRELDLVITELIAGDKGRYMCRKTLQGRAPLCLVGDKLCYSSRDGREIFVNFRKDNNFKEIARIQGAHDLVINCLSGCQCGDDALLFSGGWDKVVKQWRLANDGATQMASCAVPGYVNDLCTDTACKSVFAGGADGQIWRLDLQ